MYDGKESIYILSKHDDQFIEYFEDQQINHEFRDPIAIYMEEFFTTKFLLCFCMWRPSLQSAIISLTFSIFCFAETLSRIHISYEATWFLVLKIFYYLIFQGYQQLKVGRSVNTLSILSINFKSIFQILIGSIWFELQLGFSLALWF